MNAFRYEKKWKTLLSLALVQCLVSGCALSRAADDNTASGSDSNTTVGESVRTVDWNQAVSDAQSVVVTRQALTRDKSLAVPILAPPATLLLSGLGSVSTEAMQIITDDRGYSSVTKSPAFDILIDASNRSFATDNSTLENLSDVFDGDYQPIEGGGEISIGRYGALYSVQVLCQAGSPPSCGSERQIREIIDVLQVRIDTPLR